MTSLKHSFVRVENKKAHRNAYCLLKKESTEPYKIIVSSKSGQSFSRCNSTSEWSAVEPFSFVSSITAIFMLVVRSAVLLHDHVSMGIAVCLIDWVLLLPFEKSRDGQIASTFEQP